MEKHYDQNYFFMERYGGKKYCDSAGQLKEFGYCAGGRWNFEGILYKLIELLGVPGSILDLGAGCGGWVATCVANLITALGLEFSQFAIENAILDAHKYLVRWDLAQTPWPIEQQYDWVTAIDLFEHVFNDDVDAIINETKRCAKRWIIAKICTAQHPQEVWAAKKMSPYEEVYAQAKAKGFEWLIASGHVNSQFPKYWLSKFVDDEWKQRDDLSEWLKRSLKLPEDWRTTLILENTAWFDEEFGKDET